MTFSKTKKWLLGSLLVFCVALGATVVGIHYLSPQPAIGLMLSNTLVPIDFHRPDAVIISENLSRLPRDLLKVPLLRDTLTEDFAFYYEDNESRLSLLGALRRIAYEHDLSISETLLEQVLSSPAELSVWRGPEGNLRYWMLSLDQNLAARIVQNLAKAALNDMQLSKMSEFDVQGSPVALYRLNYGYNRHLVFASHRSRLVLLSDAGMLLASEHNLSDEAAPDILPGQLAHLVDSLSSDTNKQRALRQELQLPEKISGHSVIVSTHFLSFSYQRFFPSLQALRFDFDGKAWNSQMLVNSNHQDNWDSKILWQATPDGPAACVSLPLDWSSSHQLVTTMLPSEPELTSALGSLKGPLGVCWYEKSRLSSPLFIARFENEADAKKHADTLAKLFTAVVGAREFVKGQRFAVEEQQTEKAHYWGRVVSARYGSQLATDEPFKDKLSAARYFPVKMALSGADIFFSPDGKLVEQAVAVQQKLFPALDDGMQQADKVVMRITPSTLSALLEREIYASLPGQLEPLFRNAAKEYLVPRLQTLASYPPITLRRADSPLGLSIGPQWQPITLEFEEKR